MKRLVAALVIAAGIFLSIPATTPTAFAQQSEQSDEARQGFVGSRHSNVYHLPTCSAARRIKSENLITFKNRDEAVKAGYRPCKICRP